MAAPDAAAGPSTSRDVYSDKHHNKEDLDRIAEANELFDAVLTGSVDHVKNVTRSVGPKEFPLQEKAQTITEDQPASKAAPTKRLSVYIGNFPWWTSDRDITVMLQTMGVRDLKEIKFAENRVNGQSRGYAELVVASEGSFKILLEKIPTCNVNGERLDCRFVTRQNLNIFEDIANKRMPQRLNSKDSKDESSERIPPPISHELVPPPMPPLYPPHTLPHAYPSLPSPYLGPPPPPFTHMPPNIPPPMPPPIFPPHVAHIHSQPPPSLHINPAFFSPGQDGHSSNAYSQQKPPPQNTDGDFEELMNRNRAVASSAISKAVSGAAAGDHRVAMETLLTAIAIIKQSRVYTDERCQALVSSLKDCLVSIQGNHSHRSSGRDKDRDRDRGRDRERERDRERDQEDSYGWESEGMSRRHRDRSWSGDRVKERSRERERSRDYRDRDRDRYR